MYEPYRGYMEQKKELALDKSHGGFAVKELMAMKLSYYIPVFHVTWICTLPTGMFTLLKGHF